MFTSAACSETRIETPEDSPLPAVSCESLSSLALPNSSITLAETLPAGEFALSQASESLAQILAELPSLCRIMATLTPSPDSDIKIEVWIPAESWNGRFQGVGNGGWAGYIDYQGLARALTAGYATAATDTGHSEPGGSFALGHPEKLKDFSYRAVHEMTVTARALIERFYARAPAYSYWSGCSAGVGKWKPCASSTAPSLTRAPVS